MHLLPILKVVGTLLLVLGGAQVVPMVTALAYGEEAWRAFLYSALGAGVVGGGLALGSRTGGEISEKDGFAVVTLGWVVAALCGAVPFFLSGVLPTATDAIFESMSGFTTTGSTVLPQLEGLSRGILLWRSMTQWFGGMGIIVLALVILPALGIGGMQLFKREVPGPYSEKITPRLRDTSRALWSVYILLTGLEAVALVLAGMSPFHAVNHALTTLSTGGFSTLTESVGGFGSPAIEWIITLFMLLGGMNFALHYRFLVRSGNRTVHLRDLEWRWFMALAALSSLAVAGSLWWSKGYGLSAALSKGAFQVVSILTTTGFGSDNYALWGAFPQFLLLLLMIAGGCAGSTSGGVKMVRILLVLNFLRHELLRLVHPKVVIHARLGAVRVTNDIQANILAFIFLYLTTLAVAVLLIAADGESLLTAIGAAASALGNIGPGLGAVGPADTFAGLSNFTKWVLTITMLLGRLELMTVLILFSPQLWRK